MKALPTELWLIIFDLVIQEGIIRVDHCDHTIFPYIQSALSTTRLRYHFYNSYYWLRLVCRSFKAILGGPPSQILLPSSTFPLSTSIRAVILDLDAWPTAHFQLLSAEMSSCRRVVYLDVTCGLGIGSNRPSLSDFLRACAGRAFHEVQRLTLRIVNVRVPREEPDFWACLHDAFPLLVALVITQENATARHVMLCEADRVISFEWLDILYLDHAIGYSGCCFPRLRHASVWNYFPSELEILKSSPHLESLFIRSHQSWQINVNLWPRLKLLGTRDVVCHYVVSPEAKHTLEHLWIFICDQVADHWSLMELLTRLPRIVRVTVELLSSIEPVRTRIAQELQRIDFAAIGMTMRPPVDGDSLLVIERSALVGS